jgi:dTDP-4-dehydrorhamnose reductase
MIWLIGNKGMLGTELARVFEARGLEYVGTDRDIDITDAMAVNDFASSSLLGNDDWIVNCAAYTAVDKAEEDRDTCERINATGPAIIARAANARRARLIHISTDYVFNGNGDRPYREDDPTDPTGFYGLTKRDGERAAIGANERTYVVRTAWLYGKYGNNFVKTMLRLMGERDSVSVVNDQRGSPTWAFDLSAAVATLIESKGNIPFGVYHFTDEGNISWFDFAREIYRQGRAKGLIPGDCEIKPCTSAEYPSRVRRPPYSVLDKTKIKRALDIEIPSWESSLARYLESQS